MHPDWLEAFVAVAEHGSFARAAEALRRAQPTVHVQVTKLAEHLGVTLYRRSGRGIELTEDGRRVAAYARESLGRNLAFTQALRGKATVRPVVLTAGEGAFLYLLGPAVQRAKGDLGAPLHLWVGGEEQVQARVLDGRADVGVTTRPPDPTLEALELVHSKLCLALPRGHRLARRRNLTFADLSEESWVAPEADRPLRQRLERAARAAGFELNVAVQAHGWPLLLHFVDLGMGVAVVNEICTLPKGVLRKPLLDMDGPRYWAVRRADEPRRDAQALWAALSGPAQDSGSASSATSS